MDVLYRLSRAVKRIPLIANGDFFDAGDLQVAKDLGAHSFMIARAAQWNVTGK